jgi:hypothetical protein
VSVSVFVSVSVLVSVSVSVSVPVSVAVSFSLALSVWAHTHINEKLPEDFVFLPIGFGDILPENDSERAQQIIITLVGAVVFAFVIGSVKQLSSSSKNAVKQSCLPENDSERAF